MFLYTLPDGILSNRPLPHSPPSERADPWPSVRLRYLRRTARLLLSWPHPLGDGLARSYQSAREGFGEVLKRRPDAFYGALLLPQVSAPLYAGLGSGEEGALSEAIVQLLLELSRREALPERGVFWAPPTRRLLSPPLGQTWERPVVGMLFRNGEVDRGEAGTISLSPGAPPSPDARRTFWPLRHGGWLAGIDNNPLCNVEAHPEKEGNVLSFGDTSPERWVECIDAARDVVATVLPALSAEHAGFLSTIVPVGTHASRSNSASYREAIGLVYVSLHPDPLTMAEALIHEVQHNKLNLLSHLGPLLSNESALYRSPVRPDPRPLWGVLLAVHAFLPVEEMYRRLAAMSHPLSATSRFAARFEEIREGNREGMAVLEAAIPLGKGNALLAGMREMVGRLDHRDPPPVAG